MQRAAAVAQLQEVVVAQLAVAEAEGAFCCTEDKLNVTSVLIVTFILSLMPVKVIICPDGTSRWRSSAARCDVFVDCRQKPGYVMHGIGSPSRWGTWWAIDGNDTKDVLLSLAH